MSEQLVRAPSRTRPALRPFAWTAVAVLGLEAVAGLAGASFLAYKAVRVAGFTVNPGANLLGRSVTVALLLALVAAALAMAVAILRHARRPDDSPTSLRWAALAVLGAHATVVVGSLMRAAWPLASAVGLAALVLTIAWVPCLRTGR